MKRWQFLLLWLFGIIFIVSWYLCPRYDARCNECGYCPSYANSVGIKFCEKCGADLPGLVSTTPTCANCGEECDAPYCPHCGTKNEEEQR